MRKSHKISLFVSFSTLFPHRSSAEYQRKFFEESSPVYTFTCLEDSSTKPDKQNLILCIQVAGHAAVSCQITCNMFSSTVSFSDVCLFMMRSAETSSTAGHHVIRSRALGIKHHWTWVFTHFLSLLSSHLLNSPLSKNLFSLSLSSSLIHDVCGSLSYTNTL
jgi:hypothetical protein